MVYKIIVEVEKDNNLFVFKWSYIMKVEYDWKIRICYFFLFLILVFRYIIIYSVFCLMVYLEFICNKKFILFCVIICIVNV